MLAVLRDTVLKARRPPGWPTSAAARAALVAQLLARTVRVRRVLGVDVSHRALERAAQRLHLDTMPDRQRERVDLLQSSLTYADERLAGLDAAVLMEVIEHVDPPRLGALEQTVFGAARPGTVVVTTPNAEHNVRFAGLRPGRDAAPGSPVRVDPGAVPRLGGRGGRPPRLPGALPAGRPGRPRGRPAHPAGGVHPCLTPVPRPRSASTGSASTGPASTERRELGIPELSLVVLVGVSGSGKTTFARQHFGPFEVISSDFCRGLVADDENDQAATADAFDVLEYIAGKRLAAGRLTVVDATNVQPAARKQFVELARAHDVLPVAIVLDLPKSCVRSGTPGRPDRTFGAQVIHRQHDQLRRSLRSLSREGFRKVHVLRSPAQVDGGRGGPRTAAHRLPRPDRAVRRDRRRARLPGRTGGAARPARLRDHPGRGRAAPSARCRRPAGPRCSSATWWTGDRIRPGCSGW